MTFGLDDRRFHKIEEALNSKMVGNDNFDRVKMFIKQAF